jgi:hypothetical protein
MCFHNRIWICNRILIRNRNRIRNSRVPLIEVRAAAVRGTIFQPRIQIGNRNIAKSAGLKEPILHRSMLYSTDLSLETGSFETLKRVSQP